MVVVWGRRGSEDVVIVVLLQQEAADEEEQERESEDTAADMIARCGVHVAVVLAVHAVDDVVAERVADDVVVERVAEVLRVLFQMERSVLHHPFDCLLFQRASLSLQVLQNTNEIS